MARREYHSSARCAQEGCTEPRAFWVFSTRAEQRDFITRQKDHPWRCARHRAPDEVLSAESSVCTAVLVSYETDFGYPEQGAHQFWATEENAVLKKGGNGFSYGPGFKAFAKDFPVGTRLVVTARVELPEFPSAGESE